MTTFDTSSFTAKRCATLARQIGKAKKGEQKMRVLEKASSARDERKLLWHLTREGHLEAHKEPSLWGELAQDVTGVSGKDVVALLGKVERVDPALSIFLFAPFWPQAFDDLVFQIYPRDPAPFDESWQSWSPDMKDGFKLVLRRLGKIGRESIERDMADAFAAMTVDTMFWIGFPTSNERLVWWTADGQVARVDITHPTRGEYPSDKLYELIELFTTKEAYRQAVLARAMSRNSFSATTGIEALRVAAPEQLAHLLAAHGDPMLFRLLREERSDSPAELLDVACELLRRYEEKEAEIVAIHAILVAKARKETAPAPLWDFIKLRAHDVQRGQGVEETIAALAEMPEGRARAFLGAALDEPGTFARAVPIVAAFDAAFDTPELWDRLRAGMIRYARSASVVTVHWPSVIEGLATFDDVERLALAAETEPTDLQPVYREALVIALGKRTQLWPSNLDKFLGFYGWGNDHDFSRSVGEALISAFRKLPRERAEPLLISAIDPTRSGFTRAFTCIHLHPSDRVLGHAFDVITKNSARIYYDYVNWVENSIYMMRDAAMPFIERSIASDAEGKLLDWYKNGLGVERFEAIRARLAASTGKDVARAPSRDELLAIEAQKRAKPGAKSRFYVLDVLEGAGTQGPFTVPLTAVNRVGGTAIGVDAETWPHDEEGNYFDHVFTLDLDTVPELRKVLHASKIYENANVYENARAIALFIRDEMHHEAFEPGNDDTRLVVLSAGDIAKGVWTPEKKPTRGRTFRAIPVDAPASVLDHEPSARVLGRPRWMQRKAHDGEFLLQFDEGFSDVNLGDFGAMYVFADTAFVQSH